MCSSSCLWTCCVALVCPVLGLQLGATRPRFLGWYWEREEGQQSHQFLAQPSSCSCQYVTSWIVPTAFAPSSHCEVRGNLGSLLDQLLSGLVNVSLQPLVGLFPVDGGGRVTLCSHKALLSPFLLRLLHIRKQYLHVCLPSYTVGLWETWTVYFPNPSSWCLIAMS